MATIPTAKTTGTTTAVATKPITAVAAAQTQPNATSLVQNQGTAGSNPRSSNPPQGFAGTTPNLPAPGKSSADSLTPGTPADKTAAINQTMGLVSQNAVVQTLSGIGTGTSTSQSERDRLTDLQGTTGKTDKAAFDQGFSSKPASLASNPVASGPMDAFSGNSVGGPVGAAAANDPNQRGNGIAGQGIGAVSKDPNGDAIKGMERIQNAEDIAEEAAAGDLTDALVDAAEFAAEYFWKIEGLAVTAAAEVIKGAINEGQLIYEKKQNEESADEAARQADVNWAKAREAQLLRQQKNHTPDPENTGSNINITTQTLLNQLNAAKAGKPASQGGSGDITPATNGGIDAVARNGSITANQASVQGQNLFGQPVNPALDNVSGGNKGLNGFNSSTGAGAINPGNEAGSTNGDPRFQQDPAKALGSTTPAAAGPSLPTAPSSPSEQTSSVSATLAANVRDLTLTGTAAVNGRGNALDNQITGNGAANELRGEAGNDSLTGQAGNDLLDGGSGRDLLSGGSGADRFRFSGSGGFGASQADRITDFNRSEGDRIEISRSGFGLAADAVLSFQVVRTEADLSQALSSSTLLIQDLRDGSLLFNQNGMAAGMGQGGLFGQVQQALTLQGSDFSLIA